MIIEEKARKLLILIETGPDSRKAKLERIKQSFRECFDVAAVVADQRAAFERKFAKDAGVDGKECIQTAEAIGRGIRELAELPPLESRIDRALDTFGEKEARAEELVSEVLKGKEGEC